MNRQAPKINAGSMADIAFLLLIFFLVTTTIDVDEGIYTKLPRKNTTEITVPFNDKNILDVIINAKNELYVENEIVEISNLTEVAINFIDNAGGTDIDGNPCSWCKGDRNTDSSDHPSKALIAIDANRAVNYDTYVKVLDQIYKAYGKLRDRYARDTYQISYKGILKKEKSSTDDHAELRQKIKDIREKYPLLIVDSQIQK